ncbi:hypothetical protein ABIB15_001309 [Marisediminicola sp. UYEF4]|uniref:hypothetical protein n=1 Tax=Marisediminicola sp. UYEF4 TaxID=1756384 RepID=UPI003393543E
MSAPRRRDIARLTVAGLFIAAGALLIGALTAPQTVEHAYGAAKTSITGAVDEVREVTFGVLPTVQLGSTGGMPSLDQCDGTFTEMASYEREGVPPVWAAHNNCLGDVLLPWESGQHIRLEGNGQVYEVIDIRHTDKTWATTEDLIGLGGSLALQTCLYGEDRIKFVGLEPVRS